MRWVKWNSASRFSWIVTFSKPAGAEKRSCAANKDTHELLHLNFTKALRSSGAETLCHSALLWKSDMRVSALTGYGGDTKDLLKNITQGIPVRYPHRMCYTQSTGLPCHNSRPCNTAGSTSLPIRGRMLSPDLRGDPTPSSHPAACLAATEARVSAALTPQMSLMAGGGGFLPFLTRSVHPDTGTVPLQPGLKYR